MVRNRNVVLILAATAAQAGAQSFNIDIGPLGTAPPSNYSAAGLSGFWNSLPAVHTTPFTTGPHANDYMLVDVNGTQTTVGMHQYGGMDHVSTSDPSVSGNDAILLNDYLATHSAVLESCVYFNGLQNGQYEVLTYAWMPNQPSIMQQVRFDFHPGVELAGGAWPGQHMEGVTYTHEIIPVTTGFIGLHIGIPPGGNTAIGAAWNAIQLRKIQPADVTIPATSGAGLVLTVIALFLAGGTVFSRRTA